MYLTQYTCILYTLSIPILHTHMYVLIHILFTTQYALYHIIYYTPIHYTIHSCTIPTLVMPHGGRNGRVLDDKQNPALHRTLVDYWVRH